MMITLFLGVKICFLSRPPDISIDFSVQLKGYDQGLEMLVIIAMCMKPRAALRNRGFFSQLIQSCVCEEELR